MTTLPAAFWQAERETLLTLLLPRLEYVAILAQQHAALKMGRTFNQALSNKDAEAWARDYVDTVLEELGTTTESNVGAILGDWISTPGSTFGDLQTALMQSGGFGQVRAARIAQTEITRAYAQGESMAYERELGITAAILPVENSHPGCYCWLSVKRVGNQQVIVWQTNKDDRVCTRDLDTPWGTVGGCEALDNVIVSEGDYLGMDYDEAAAMGKMAKGGALSKSADAYSLPPYIRFYGKDGKHSAWIVDGKYVRNNIFLDFTQGGNSQRYDFIPKNEIWLDDCNENEAGYVLLHELIESRLMAGGMGYDAAHTESNTAESAARDDPDKLAALLAAEGWTK